jgi:hypothetical protein
MADITMSLDDTLELDALIQESNKPEKIINITDGTEGTDFDLDGIQTHTGIFNPTNAGTYNIEINGQKLTVKVKESSAIPDSVVERSSDNNTFGTTTRRGVGFNSTKTWPEIGFKISGGTSGFSIAYIGTLSDNSVIQTKDVSGLSGLDTFTFDVTISPNTDYFVALDDNGNGFTAGENNSVSTPVSSNDDVLTMTGKYNDATTVGGGKLATILSIGNVGFL